MMDLPTTIENPILRALRGLSTADLTELNQFDLDAFDSPGMVVWAVELGRLLSAERLARRNLEPLSDTNALWLATSKLTPEDRSGLITALHRLTVALPDGALREFIVSLGLLTGSQDALTGRYDPARMN